MHTNAVIDMLELGMFNTVDFGFKQFNSAFGRDNQSIRDSRQFPDHFFLVRIGILKHRMQIDESDDSFFTKSTG